MATATKKTKQLSEPQVTVQAVIPARTIQVRATTAPLVMHVNSAPDLPDDAMDLQPLFYRGVTYMMPASIVRAPFPTFTFRHLDKVGMFALEGNRPKVVSSLQRAIASAIDAPSLIKIAAVAHSEECPDEALASLQKALKVSAKHPEIQELVHAGAQTLGYVLA